MYVYVTCTCLVPMEARKKNIRSHETEVSGGYEPSCGFREFNSGSLHKQPLIHLFSLCILVFLRPFSFTVATLDPTPTTWVSIPHVSCAFLWGLSFEVKFLSPYTWSWIHSWAFCQALWWYQLYNWMRSELSRHVRCHGLDPEGLLLAESNLLFFFSKLTSDDCQQSFSRVTAYF